MKIYPCKICQSSVGWVSCPTGGWWAHLVHPDDGHDAYVEEAVMTEEVNAFAYSLSVEADHFLNRDVNPNELVEMARELLTDLLERGWRPPIE